MSDLDAGRALHLAESQTYNDGRLYRPAAGRAMPREAVIDLVTPSRSVVGGKPEAEEFLRLIHREMKLRFYASNTIRNYHGAVRRFLKWFGREPHRVSREDVRAYLEVMVDGGASSSHVGITISAIRNVFDKMCCRQVTLGLATPRKPSRQPVVLNQTEIRMMLEAARSLRDKMLMSLMYGVGLRVSEVSRLRWSELDFERKTVRVVLGKGRKDRLVILPESLIPLLRQLSKAAVKCEFLFPCEGCRQDRHLSSRTVQRVVKVTAQLAGISKPVTPHSFRHSFATHLIEDGLDIRFIQKLLGHAKLETTTIYTKVAVLKQSQIRSPLDRIGDVKNTGDAASNRNVASVGRMRLVVEPSKEVGGVRQAFASIVICCERGDVTLSGIVLRETRPGWVAMDVPPEEHWCAAIQQLPDVQRLRILTPQFLDRVRLLLGERFVSQRGGLLGDGAWPAVAG